MTTSLDMIRGRSNIVTMTNNSGGALIAGDVCVQDATADENVTTTTSAASTSKVFIAAESIGIGAAGKFYESGYCPFVNVSASATRGYFLFTHTVAKQATSASSYGAGAFGRVLKAGTSPSAIIYSATAQLSSGGVTRSGSTTDGNLAVWNGANADSIKDGGAVPGAGAMVKLAETVLGAPAANFDFTNISGAYSHLKIIMQARGDTVAVGTAVHIHFNNDSAGNYDSESFDAVNATLAGGGQVATANNFIGGIPAASATANQAGTVDIVIHNYARTTFYKTYTGIGGQAQAQTAATQQFRICMGQWRNTAAITRITLVPGAGNFDTGSMATLYGLS